MALTAICKFTYWEVQATWNGIYGKAKLRNQLFHTTVFNLLLPIIQSSWYKVVCSLSMYSLFRAFLFKI